MMNVRTLNAIAVAQFLVGVLGVIAVLSLWPIAGSVFFLLAWSVFLGGLHVWRDDLARIAGSMDRGLWVRWFYLPLGEVVREIRARLFPAPVVEDTIYQELLQAHPAELAEAVIEALRLMFDDATAECAAQDLYDHGMVKLFTDYQLELRSADQGLSTIPLLAVSYGYRRQLGHKFKLTRVQYSPVLDRTVPLRTAWFCIEGVDFDGRVLVDMYKDTAAILLQDAI